VKPSAFSVWFTAQFGPPPTGTLADARRAVTDAEYQLERARAQRAKHEERAEIERVARYAWNAATDAKGGGRG